MIPTISQLRSPIESMLPFPSSLDVRALNIALRKDFPPDAAS